ncbi:MAG TPA: hypothetical protein VHL81_15210 [Gemmatimonadales bacterium]|jgi:hypothetical protein|nr:hypothetical protein [Gemmatimonadales bacterium]
MRLRGRHWLVLWLVLLLGVLGSITARQAAGFRTARRLRDLREERMALEARRGELERRIRVGSSRQVLVPIVEHALGLHEPSDSEFVLFAVPPAGPAAR